MCQISWIEEYLDIRFFAAGINTDTELHLELGYIKDGRDVWEDVAIWIRNASIALNRLAILESGLRLKKV